MTDAKELNIGYGLLDMRNGERLDVVERQLKETKSKNLSEWYFDILHTANQTPKALLWLGEVKTMIRTASKLKADKIVVHLNTSDAKLRARNELFKKAYEHGAPAVEQKVIR